ncbi:MAG: hypothetical protein K0R05_4335 [Anaerocolumna sp.]|jgi:photosystem II stability/assembly factor-like uncharacterized protein|nr:hypothetical protein [Anaerocolumna sp.]
MFKKLLIFYLVVVILLSSFSPMKVKAASSGKDVSWTKLTKETQSNNLYDITYNKAKTYVTVGDDGMILWSKDGKEWNEVNLQSTENLNAVTTNGTKFIAVGNNGTILHSVNGKAWTKGKINISYTYKQVEESYKVVDKSYNIKWSTKLKASQLQIKNILWDGKKYVATAYWEVITNGPKGRFLLSGTFILTSKDGINWDSKYIEIPDIERIIYTGSQYVAISLETVSTSKDLNKWTTTYPNIRGEFNDIIFNNGKYVAITWEGSISARSGGIYTSSDAVKWKEVINNKEIGSGDPAGTKSKYGKANGFYDLVMYDIMWDGKQYIISGLNGMLITSKDAKNWNMYTKLWNVFFEPFIFDAYIASGKNAFIKKTIYDGTQYIMIGDNGTILTTTNLKTGYVMRSRIGVDFYSMTYDSGKRYLALGLQDLLWESSNGYNFEQIELPDVSGTINWNGIAAHKGIVIAPFQTSVGWSYADSEYLYSSKPGVWKRMKFPKEFRSVYDITYMNNKFYVFTTSGIITSKDGISWSNFVSAKNLIKSAVYSGKVFVGQNTFRNIIGSSDEALHTSKDGVKWNKIIININGKKYNISAEKVLWNGKQFVTIGGYIYSVENSSKREKMIGFSADGINWKIHKKDVIHLEDGVYGGGRYITVDRDGLVYYSANGIDYKRSKLSTTQEINSVIWDGKRFLAGGNTGVILTSITNKNITIPKQTKWVDVIESYAITKDGYPVEEIPVDKEQENFLVEGNKRISIIKKIGELYDYSFSSSEGTDYIVGSLDGTDTIWYEFYKSEEYKNKLDFYIYKSGNERSIDAASEIISQHTDISVTVVKELINKLINENQEKEGIEIINGVKFKISYIDVNNNAYHLILNY